MVLRVIELFQGEVGRVGDPPGIADSLVDELGGGLGQLQGQGLEDVGVQVVTRLLELFRFFPYPLAAGDDEEGHAVPFAGGQGAGEVGEREPLPTCLAGEGEADDFDAGAIGVEEDQIVAVTGGGEEAVERLGADEQLLAWVRSASTAWWTFMALSSPAARSRSTTPMSPRCLL